MTSDQKNILAAASFRRDGFASVTSSELRNLAPLLTTTAGSHVLAFWLHQAEKYPDSDLSQFMREENINPQVLPPNVGALLGPWAITRFEAANKEKVRSLSAAEKWLLDDFIKTRAPLERINFDLETKHFEEWEHSRKKRVDDARLEFPAFALAHADGIDHFSSLPDQHEAAYLRKATAAFIKAHPPLARLQSEGWNFSNLDQATLAKVLDSLMHPLPGGELELTYFIDPKASDHDVATRLISTEWKKRAKGEPSYLLHDDIDEFLRQHVGATVVLVGHVADRFFAMDRGPHHQPLMLDIPELTRKAAHMKVLLIPIGCNSAKAGAPFGFARPIATEEVAKFIQAIPVGSLSIADLLAAMGSIGPISVDPSRIAEQLDVVIQTRDGREDVTMIRIPESAYAPSSYPSPVQGQTGYQQFTEEWIAANRPFLDRGPFAAVRTFVRHVRGAGIVSVGVAMGLLAMLLHQVRGRIEGTSAKTGTGLYKLEGRLTKLALVIVVLGLLYAIIAALWTPWLVIVLFVILYIAFTAVAPKGGY